MHDFLVALAPGLPAALVALLALLASLRNGRDIRVLHLQINSRMDKWMADARAAAHAEGHVAGELAAHNRRKGDR